MLQHTYSVVFTPKGYGVCENDGGPRVRGIQQRHVSALSNAFEVFHVNFSLFRAPKSKDGVRQIACPQPRCIIDVSVSTHPASLSQVPVRKRNRRQKFCHWILHEREEGRLQSAEICGIINALYFLLRLCEIKLSLYIPVSNWVMHVFVTCSFKEVARMIRAATNCYGIFILWFVCQLFSWLIAWSFSL